MKCCGFYSPCRMPDCLPDEATPRTDALQNEMSATGRIDAMDSISVLHLCRQLERELAAAKALCCDWDCPFSRDIGLTEQQIEARDDAEDASEAQADGPNRG